MTGNERSEGGEACEREGRREERREGPASPCGHFCIRIESTGNNQKNLSMASRGVNPKAEATAAALNYKPRAKNFLVQGGQIIFGKRHRKSVMKEMGTPEVAKKRTLPTWMTEKVFELAQEPTKVKRKRRKKAAFSRTETIYCMNEAELVDTALCILAENCKNQEAEVMSSEDEVQESQQMPPDPQCSSVSGSNSSGKARIATIEYKPPNMLETWGCSEKVKSDGNDDNDDALKYVREIFFS